MLQNIRSYSDFYSSQRKEVLLDKQRVWRINSQDNYSFNVGYAFWGNNLRFFLWSLKTEVFRDSEHVTPCSWHVEDAALGVTNPRPAAVFQPHFTEPGQGLVFTSGNFQNREDSRHHSSRVDRGFNMIDTAGIKNAVDPTAFERTEGGIGVEYTYSVPLSTIWVRSEMPSRLMNSWAKVTSRERLAKSFRASSLASILDDCIRSWSCWAFWALGRREWNRKKISTCYQFVLL